MERRNRSIKALDELSYIDSLDDEQRASNLSNWVGNYLKDDQIFEFDLEHDDLLRLFELIYKNLEFLKKYQTVISSSMDDTLKIKKFIKSRA